MEEMKGVNKKNASGSKVELIFPTPEMSSVELLASVEEAEKGPFHSVQESMTKFEAWLKVTEEK